MFQPFLWLASALRFDIVLGSPTSIALTTLLARPHIVILLAPWLALD
jgi:hypothetical protein